MSGSLKVAADAFGIATSKIESNASARYPNSKDHIKFKSDLNCGDINDGTCRLSYGERWSRPKSNADHDLVNKSIGRSAVEQRDISKAIIEVDSV